MKKRQVKGALLIICGLCASSLANAMIPIFRGGIANNLIVALLFCAGGIGLALWNWRKQIYRLCGRAIRLVSKVLRHISPALILGALYCGFYGLMTISLLAATPMGVASALYYGIGVIIASARVWRSGLARSLLEIAVALCGLALVSEVGYGRIDTLGLVLATVAGVSRALSIYYLGYLQGKGKAEGDMTELVAGVFAAGAVFLVVSFFNGDLQGTPVIDWWMIGQLVIVGSLGLTIPSLTKEWSRADLAADQIIYLSTGGPIISALIGWLFAQPMTVLQWIGIIVLSIAIVMGGTRKETTPKPTFNDFG
ncbi:hypothetical protein LUW76_33880 [Actinomadura madurae]|uniref:hypothetical protein n=1 Tax=Actinomadura madurae TaxID=1993 RepID=UPI002025D8DC|nr:hypothetical protein [Actinomadura madurae]URM98924.1 hypothetical protein LUW76_33880 [Actinomadura madurae]URN09615.1 hypothetical protein LUW74_43880 [Actinomadura madurae]